MLATMIGRWALISAMVLYAGGAAAQLLDPGRTWRTAETTHFRIHFEDEARASAGRTGEAAERAYALLASELNWAPRDKVDVVLYSGVDLSNGFASPLPFNHSGIFLTAPSEGELLDRSNWLELVLLHELTHVLHLDKASGTPEFLRHIFGRMVFAFPNVLQPAWLVEGLAVQSESRAGQGMGRLHGAYFEAQLRDERQRGFMSLREINADGRRLPLNRNYLYGAYFFDYLVRTYGPYAAVRHVDWYSAQFVPFRVHNSTVAVTQKQMDTVWTDFLADLDQQVQQRSAVVLQTPERVGVALATPWWGVESLSMAPNGDMYVVAQDGINAPGLWVYRAGRQAKEKGERLTTVHPKARIDVRADGAVLIAQPEVCGGYELMYDLYQWSARQGLQRLTECQRDLNAVWLGRSEQIVALRNDRNGLTQVALFNPNTGATRVLAAGEASQQWVALASTLEGDAVYGVRKEAGQFSVLRLNVNDATQNVVWIDSAPITQLHVAADGALSFISTRDGVPNVWRWADGALTPLTHSHTAVLHFGGIAQDGTAALGTLQQGQVQLRVLADDPSKPLEQAKVEALPPLPPLSPTPVLLPPATQPVALEHERDYSALPSLRPHGWWPVFFTDRGLVNVGASVFGADALGLHNYLITPYVELTQGEALGSAEYAWRNRHFFAAQRELRARRWTDRNGHTDTLEYERASSAQWVSLARAVQIERSAAVGVGAATQRRDGVVVDGPSTRELDNRLAALVALYDSRAGGLLSDGPSRGQQAQLFYETYRPFKDTQRSPYTGEVTRLLWDGYWALGRSVLSGHWVEGRGQAGRTENFELGGAVAGLETLAPQLNERDVTLRGYRRGDAGLIGANVRRLTVQWRTPLADIDRHAMVPPLGVNRVSGAVFYEAGGVWNRGGGPQHWLRAVGAEAITELKLGYLLPLQVRVGVARGLDRPGETRAYVVAGRLI